MSKDDHDMDDNDSRSNDLPAQPKETKPLCTIDISANQTTQEQNAWTLLPSHLKTASMWKVCGKVVRRGAPPVAQLRYRTQEGAHGIEGLYTMDQTVGQHNPDFRVLISHHDLMARDGWTRQAIRDLLCGCDYMLIDPHHTSSAPIEVYSLARVLVAEGSPDFPRFVEERARQAQLAILEQKRRRDKTIRTRWDKHPTVADAMADICAAVQEDHRYALQTGLDRHRKQAIYEQTTKITRLLYETGRCASVELPVLRRAFDCCWSYDFGPLPRRRWSDGRDEGVNAYYVFTFQFADKTFNWHLPHAYVSFPINEAIRWHPGEIDVLPTSISEEVLNDNVAFLDWFIQERPDAAPTPEQPAHADTQVALEKGGGHEH